jgi:hypothetical protein
LPRHEAVVAVERVTLRAFSPPAVAWSFAFGALACAASRPEVRSFSRGNAGCTPSHAAPEQAFSAAQAQRALIEAEETASACSRAAKKTAGRVLMTWGNGGCIESAQFHLQDTGLTARDVECIVSAFFAAHTDPFSGEPVSVVKSMLAE